MAVSMAEHEGPSHDEECDREAAVDEVRRKIDVGMEQAKAGQLHDGRTFFAELKRTIRLRRQS